MKLVIGVQTCNRLAFTKQTIDSVLKWNPEAKDLLWVVSDDGSKDSTKEYIESLPFIDDTVFWPDQTGITMGLQRLIKLAAKHGDIILYLQNDWRQTRQIDFKAIESFYEQHLNAGHIQTIRYKGDGLSRPSSSAKMINLHTREKIVPGVPIVVGNEKIIPGNWHYADIPGFTSVKFALRMFDGMILGRHSEGIRNKNIYESGCDNYMLDDQPYRNIDFDRTNITYGRRY